MSTGSDLERGLAFLAARQDPSGQFPVLVGRELERPGSPAEPDSTPFATALVAHSLSYCSAPAAHEMVARALGFLRATREPGSVWRYWPAGHPHHDAIPPDLDDTACVSELLQRHGVAFPDNRDLLLANRDPRGLFYTWLSPRFAPPPRSRRFWRVALRCYRAPLRAHMFWRLNESDPHDVDGVVNANVLFYLGYTASTAPVVAHLADIVREGREASCDKWHRNPFTFHYMLARNYERGVTALAPTRDLAVEWLLARSNGDGSIGATVLDTALAACALLAWGTESRVIERAVDHLRAVQRADGSWPVWPMYWGGPDRYWGWGSEELTTGFCLEALLRCPAT